MIESQIEEWVVEDDSIFLLICVDEKLLGRVYLRDISQNHEMLGYRILPEELGHGYVTEG